MTLRRRAIHACFACLAACSLAIFPTAAQSVDSLTGFSSAHAPAERNLEDSLKKIPSANRAEANLRQLTAEPHMAGTEASHRVTEWLAQQFQSYGFDVEMVPYSVWLPQPKQTTLELISKRKETLGTPEMPSDTDKNLALPFNAYSPSGDVTAPVVYVNFGMASDYRMLMEMGISVEGKIVLARYGRGYRGVKAKLAEEHHAAGLILYSDPADDGFRQGDVYPKGPWRPDTGVQQGSVLYTELYPGDPLVADAGNLSAQRLSPNAAPSLPHIPTMPISALDASAIMRAFDGKNAPRDWQGGLPVTYRVESAHAKVHMKLVMDYAQRTVYNVIAKLHGADDDSWVLLGNHHDAWVYGAADPGSGTASMLEAARALGELARTGWKPRRTIVICEWDGEEEGLLGSTAWVESHLAELQSKAVAYINTDVGVTGANFAASATPSMNDFLRDVARSVTDPTTGHSLYEIWRGHNGGSETANASAASRTPEARSTGEAPVVPLGAGSDFSSFFNYAGIPSADVSFAGDYGVYHSRFDDFYWMQHFGDPTFAYHAALARVLGVAALRLSDADVLPFHYGEYAAELVRASNRLAVRASHTSGLETSVKDVVDAASEFGIAAVDAAPTLRRLGTEPVDPAVQEKINRDLVSVEESLLVPQGLAERPWYKHSIFAPGLYTGYSAEMLPGLNDALDRNDPALFDQESAALVDALHRATEQLKEVSRTADAFLSSGNSGTASGN